MNNYARIILSIIGWQKHQACQVKFLCKAQFPKDVDIDILQLLVNLFLVNLHVQ